jgi:hypothetical protein
LRRGLLYLVATAVGYAAAIAVLAWGGDRPGNWQPWLKIPSDTYFWWECVFIGPVIVGCGLLAAVCMYLLAKPAGGKGSFDDTLALTGPAIAFATLFTLVPDLVIGVLLVTHVLDLDAWMFGITHTTLTLFLVWAYMLLYLAALIVALPLAVATVHRLRPTVAVAIGLAGVVVYQGVMFIFVR